LQHVRALRQRIDGAGRVLAFEEEDDLARSLTNTWCPSSPQPLESKRPKPLGAAKKPTAPAKPKKQKKTSRGK
jgi:hypothetical protein